MIRKYEVDLNFERCWKGDIQTYFFDTWEVWKGLEEHSHHNDYYFHTYIKVGFSPNGVAKVKFNV